MDRLKNNSAGGTMNDSGTLESSTFMTQRRKKQCKTKFAIEIPVESLRRFTNTFVNVLQAQSSGSSTKVIHALTKMAKERSTCLKLRHVDLTDAHCIALARALCKVPIISSLDVRDNRISEKGALVLRECMREQLEASARTWQVGLEAVLCLCSVNIDGNAVPRALELDIEILEGQACRANIELEAAWVFIRHLDDQQRVWMKSSHDGEMGRNSIARGSVESVMTQVSQFRSACCVMFSRAIRTKDAKKLLTKYGLVTLRDRPGSKEEHIARSDGTVCGLDLPTFIEICHERFHTDELGVVPISSNPTVELEVEKPEETLDEPDSDKEEAVPNRVSVISGSNVTANVENEQETSQMKHEEPVWESAEDGNDLAIENGLPNLDELVATKNIGHTGTSDDNDVVEAMETSDSQYQTEISTKHLASENLPSKPRSVETIGVSCAKEMFGPGSPVFGSEESRERKNNSPKSGVLDISSLSLTTLENVESVIEYQQSIKEIVASRNCLGSGKAPPSLPVGCVFHKLIRLDLSRNSIQKLGFLRPDLLPVLQVLDLSENRITSISSLGPMEKLEELRLAHNLVRDVTGLAGFSSLGKLDLSFNKLSSFTSLRGLSLNLSLDHLWLSGNEVSNHPRYRAQVMHLVPFLSSLDSNSFPPSSARKMARRHAPSSHNHHHQAASVEIGGPGKKGTSAKRQAAAAAALAAGSPSTSISKANSTSHRPLPVNKSPPSSPYTGVANTPASALNWKRELGRLAMEHRSVERLDDSSIEKAILELPADALRSHLLQLYQAERKQTQNSLPASQARKVPGTKKTKSQQHVLSASPIQTSKHYHANSGRVDEFYARLAKPKHDRGNVRQSQTRNFPSFGASSTRDGLALPATGITSERGLKSTKSSTTVPPSLLAPTDTFRRKTKFGAKEAEDEAKKAMAKEAAKRLAERRALARRREKPTRNQTNDHGGSSSDATLKRKGTVAPSLSKRQHPPSSKLSSTPILPGSTSRNLSPPSRSHKDERNLRVRPLETEKFVEANRIDDWNQDAAQQLEAAQTALDSLLRMSSSDERFSYEKLDRFKRQLIEIGLWQRMPSPPTGREKVDDYKDILRGVEMAKASVRNFVSMLESEPLDSENIERYREYLTHFDPTAEVAGLLDRYYSNREYASSTSSPSSTVPARGDGDAKSNDRLSADGDATVATEDEEIMTITRSGVHFPRALDQELESSSRARSNSSPTSQQMESDAATVGADSEGYNTAANENDLLSNPNLDGKAKQQQQRRGASSTNSSTASAAGTKSASTDLLEQDPKDDDDDDSAPLNAPIAIPIRATRTRSAPIESSRTAALPTTSPSSTQRSKVSPPSSFISLHASRPRNRGASTQSTSTSTAHASSGMTNSAVNFGASPSASPGSAVSFSMGANTNADMEGVILPDELVRQKEERTFHYDNESVASSVWSVEGQASVKRLELETTIAGSGNSNSLFGLRDNCNENNDGPGSATGSGGYGNSRSNNYNEIGSTGFPVSSQHADNASTRSRPSGSVNTATTEDGALMESKAYSVAGSLIEEEEDEQDGADNGSGQDDTEIGDADEIAEKDTRELEKSEAGDILHDDSADGNRDTISDHNIGSKQELADKEDSATMAEESSNSVEGTKKLSLDERIQRILSKTSSVATEDNTSPKEEEDVDDGLSNFSDISEISDSDLPLPGT